MNTLDTKTRCKCGSLGRISTEYVVGNTKYVVRGRLCEVCLGYLEALEKTSLSSEEITSKLADFQGRQCNDASLKSRDGD